MRCPVQIAAGYGIPAEILRDFSRFIQASGVAVPYDIVFERGSTFLLSRDLINKCGPVYVAVIINFISIKLYSVLTYVLIQEHKGQL
jgi:hypothetical protein